MAVSMHIKIDTIDGMSEVDGKEGTIQVDSFSWGATQSGSTRGISGLTAGKVNVQDLTFTKLLDTATPNHIGAVCSGQAYPTATLICEKSSGNGKKPVQYLKISMKDVLISSYAVGGSGGSDTHTETITLNFGAVQTAYTPMKPDGTPDATIQSGWDIVAGKKL